MRLLEGGEEAAVDAMEAAMECGEEAASDKVEDVDDIRAEDGG